MEMKNCSTVPSGIYILYYHLLMGRREGNAREIYKLSNIQKKPNLEGELMMHNNTLTWVT